MCKFVIVINNSNVYFKVLMIFKNVYICLMLEGWNLGDFGFCFFSVFCFLVCFVIIIFFEKMIKISCVFVIKNWVGFIIKSWFWFDYEDLFYENGFDWMLWEGCIFYFYFCDY